MQTRGGAYSPKATLVCCQEVWEWPADPQTPGSLPGCQCPSHSFGLLLCAPLAPCTLHSFAASMESWPVGPEPTLLGNPTVSVKVGSRVSSRIPSRKLHPEDRYFLGGITRSTWTDIHCLKWGTLPPLAKGRGCCIPPSVMKK